MEYLDLFCNLVFVFLKENSILLFSPIIVLGNHYISWQRKRKSTPFQKSRENYTFQ